MKSRKIFAGVLLLVWIVCGCEGRKASAWWFGESSQNVPVNEIPLPDPMAGAVSTTTRTVPLSGGGTETTTETVIEPSKSGALAGAAAGAALGAKIGTMIGGPAGTTIGAAVGGTIGGIVGWIFGPA